MFKQIAFAVFAAFLSVGCGGYIYTDGYAYDVVVEEDIPVYPDWFGQVELTWDDHKDLDLELVTPNHSLVSSDGPDVDGCYHLGNDDGEIGYGQEEILCSNPDYDSYEARITNSSERTVVAQLRTLSGPLDLEYGDIIEDVRTVSLPPWGSVTLPVIFE